MKLLGIMYLLVGSCFMILSPLLFLNTVTIVLFFIIGLLAVFGGSILLLTR